MPKNNLIHHSEETKLKIRLGMLNSTKKIGFPFGMKRSEEVRNRMSEAAFKSWSKRTKSTTNEYEHIRLPFHPNIGKCLLFKKHRLIMEKHLGRLLGDEEIVHHVDGNKRNNNIDNLILFKDRVEHKAFHMKMERIGMEAYSQWREKRCVHNLALLYQLLEEALPTKSARKVSTNKHAKTTKSSK